MAVYKREWKDKQGKMHFCWYFHRTIDGVRYRDPIPTARTRAQAESAERKFLAQIHEGKYERGKKSLTFGQFAEEVYLPHSRESKRSFKDDESRIKPLVEYFGGKKLNDISAFEIESYKIKRKNTPITSTHKDESKRTTKQRSLASINREICLMSAIFTLAIEKGEVSKNPCRKVSLYPEQRRTRYLLPDEEERLMRVLIGERSHLKEMVILAIYTGMRESEIFKLKPEKIDFVRDVINVTETKTDIDRQVPISNAARGVLIQLVERAQANSWEYLFTNPETGKRYTTIKTAWATACRKAEIKGLRFHDLRHTFGTRAADAGVPLTAIARVMGHSSTQTTEGYAHATDEGKRRAVEAAGHIVVTKRVEPVTVKVVNG